MHGWINILECNLQCYNSWRFQPKTQPTGNPTQIEIFFSNKLKNWETIALQGVKQAIF